MLLFSHQWASYSLVRLFIPSASDLVSSTVQAAESVTIVFILSFNEKLFIFVGASHRRYSTSYSTFSPTSQKKPRPTGVVTCQISSTEVPCADEVSNRGQLARSWRRSQRSPCQILQLNLRQVIYWQFHFLVVPYELIINQIFCTEISVVIFFVRFLRLTAINTLSISQASGAGFFFIAHKSRCHYLQLILQFNG